MTCSVMSAMYCVPTARRSPLRGSTGADQEAEAAPGAKERVEAFADGSVVHGRCGGGSAIKRSAAIMPDSRP